jgi:carboxypeptidase family protein
MTNHCRRGFASVAITLVLCSTAARPAEAGPYESLFADSPYVGVRFSRPGDGPSAMQIGEAGAVTGSVKDDAGGVVAGALVMLTDERNRKLRAVSNADGAFVFNDVAPGHYELVASHDGFANVYRTVDVSGGTRISVEIAMRVSLDQRVEVVASLDEFRRASGLSPLGLLLGEQEVGVLPNDPDMMLAVLRELSASTGRADEVVIYVDGQPIAARLPPKEIIQSIRISTNPFASEFAQPSAGLVEIFTKPAASSFRGEYQGTFNDSSLNARNAFEPRKTPSRTQSLGGYLGGPLVPGRWSFLAYGGHWEREDRLVVNTQVVDPATLAVQPFVESVATPNRIDSYSLRMDVMPASQHVMSVEYGRSSESRRNAGLESGLDLPERGVNGQTRDDTARLALVSSFKEGFGSELRVSLHQRSSDDAALSTGPAVLVLDTFQAGGNQARLSDHTTTRQASLSHILSYTDSSQAMRGGVQLDMVDVANQRASNTGGTFIFGAAVDPAGNLIATPLQRYLRTLQHLPGYGPSSFSITRGQPSIKFRDWRASAFIQDDEQRSATVTSSLGLRFDLQKHARRSFLNVAPRAGIAWAPGASPNHTVRAAAGLFYSVIPLEVTSDPLRYDGLNTVDLIIDQPNFFPAVPSQLDASVARPTVRADHPVYAPMTSAATASYEWHAASALTSSVGYTFRRGDRLLRTIDVNTPTGSGVLLRPDLGPILQFDSTGHSMSHEVHSTIRYGVAPFAVFGTYTLRWSRSDTDGLYTVAADARTLQGEYGRAGDDERHHGVLGTSLTFPHDWSVSALLTVGSGRPFNITTGLDNNGDLLFVDRPADVAAGAAGAIVTPSGSFNVHPAPGELMIVRNAGQGPRQFVLNAGVAKTLRFGGAARRYVIVSASAENLTNYVNYTDFNGVVTSPLFGQPNRALNPLRIELAARFGF